MKSILCHKHRVVGIIGIVALTVGLILVKPNSSQAANANLLNTYGSYIGKTGTCLSSWQLGNADTLRYVKTEYNSITLENEMKPDAILNSGGGWGGGTPTLISKAEAKQRGYYIPDNYTENNVPALNFGTVDQALKTCYENGLGMRGHTLVWHSQTPAWFFKNGYNGNGAFVSQDVMNARLEFYVKSVINHVYNNQYGSCVYAWDVVNEHFHATDGSGWVSIYSNGIQRLRDTHPLYIKKAFQFAYEALSEFKLQYSVGLFYNDYNTYQVKNQIVDLIKYVNEDEKICTGVGMQSHIKTTYPTIEDYINTMAAFAELGEVQITEMDIGSNNESEQATFVYSLFKEILKLKENGAKISALVLWGLNDNNSWRRGENALLHRGDGTPKMSYNKVLDVYAELIGEPNPDQPEPIRVEPKDGPDTETEEEPDIIEEPVINEEQTTPTQMPVATETPEPGPTEIVRVVTIEQPVEVSTVTDEITTKVTAPKKVKAILKKSSVLVKWRKVDGAYSYKVYRSLKKKGSYKIIRTVRKTKYSDKKVAKNKKYFYKVRALKIVDGNTLISAASKAAKTKK